MKDDGDEIGKEIWERKCSVCSRFSDCNRSGLLVSGGHGSGSYSMSKDEPYFEPKIRDLSGTEHFFAVKCHSFHHILLEMKSI